MSGGYQKTKPRSPEIAIPDSVYRRAHDKLDAFPQSFDVTIVVSSKNGVENRYLELFY